MTWQSRKKAMVAICELLNVLLVSMRSIMSSQTANVFGSEPLCCGILQPKRHYRVERRQWLLSGSCGKTCPVGNVFNFISYDRMTVLLQITAKYRRRRNIRGQSRKKAVVAIWELLEIIPCKFQCIQLDIFSYSTITNSRTVPEKTARVERRQWLPSGSCLTGLRRTTLPH